LPGLLYIGGWVLMMTAAMMLPTVLPLLRRFERLTAARADRRVLIGLLIAGYLLVWVAFGFAAHLVDTALHRIIRQSTCLAVNGWVVGAIALAMAGAF
jgi:predicted metal-binding membrane protein